MLSDRIGFALLVLVLPTSALGAPAARAQDRTLPVVVDGRTTVLESCSDPRTWIRHDLWVECPFDSDGDGRLDRVHVGVTRPGPTAEPGVRVPVVFETSPYFAGVARGDAFFWSAEHALGATPPARTAAPSIEHQADQRLSESKSEVGTWVPRGFAVVHSSSPGTGLSQGCPTVGGENESLAPKAVIDWLNGRAEGFTAPVGGEPVSADWATGKVAMIGTSYNGTLPLAAATTGVDGLEAIVPIAPNTSYYHYYRSNGLVRHPGGYLGEDIDVLYDFIHSGFPERRSWCDEHVRDTLLAASLDRETGDLNEFWKSRDYLESIDGVRAATLVAHAFNDWNVMPEHGVRLYTALRERGVPAMAYFHQGGHGGAPPLELVDRWFTRWVLGVENGVEADPRAWIVREGAKRSQPVPYDDYPNPEARPVVLRPTGNGSAIGALLPESEVPEGSVVAAREDATRVQTLVDDVTHSGAELAAAAASPHRLLFATPVLAHPVHLSGTPRIALRLASSAPAVNLSVWLVALPWKAGAPLHANVITRGWADPQNHRSLEESEPLEPGRTYDIAFDLQPDDQVVPAGRRIGLMVFASDRDFTLWPPPGTELSIDLAGTTLELPVVGGAQALIDALAR